MIYGFAGEVRQLNLPMFAVCEMLCRVMEVKRLGI